MSAATIHSVVESPVRTPVRPSLPSQRTAPPRLRLVPEPAPVRTISRAGQGELQLTRRGRLLLLLALVAAAAVLAFVVSGLVGGGAPASTPTHTPTRTVVVQPGQTLWSIARDIAPAADRRDTIARIVQLNALPSTDVVAGTHLAVPAR